MKPLKKIMYVDSFGNLIRIENYVTGAPTDYPVASGTFDLEGINRVTRFHHQYPRAVYNRPAGMTTPYSEDSR